MSLENYIKPETIGCVITLISILWYYVHRKWSYFERIGLPYVKPSILNIGSLVQIITGSLTFESKSKKELGPVYGYFAVTNPNIAVHDPDLLRKIYIKEFHNFPTRLGFFSKSNGEMNEGLTVLEGEAWKRCRSSITPIFSSAKLKHMHGILNDCTDRMLCDVYEITEQATKPFPVKTLVLFPKLEEITCRLGLTIWPKSALKYFKELSEAIMKRRKDHPHETKRIDIMQMMIDLEIAEKDIKNLHSGKGLTRSEIIANAMVMIIAGYENTANTIGFLAYNLAMHPDAQTRLQCEVDEYADENGDISYTSLNDMKYLDMCLNETLRLYSPVVKNARTCAHDVTIDGIQFKKGMFVDIPTFSLHRDAEFWENPEEFNPERMSDMSKIDPMVFQPFGAGPRNCIAQRFAKIEAKLAIAKLLLKYNILPSETTQKPPLDVTLKFSLNPVKPIYLNIQNRN